MTEHRYDGDDRCICGGVVVYWEDPDADGYVGEGCEIGGVWPKERERIDARRAEGEYEPTMADLEMRISSWRTE